MRNHTRKSPARNSRGGVRPPVRYADRRWESAPDIESPTAGMLRYLAASDRSQSPRPSAR